jgi:hypothetical protein
VTKTCPCGKVFSPKRSDAKYCSSACRSAAHQGRLAVAPTRRDPAVEGAPLGIAAIELARTLSDPSTPASSMARLASQLERTLAAATRGGNASSAPGRLRSEFLRRRAAQMGGA